MLGSGIGKLSVQIKTSGDTKSVWEKSGEQGDRWIQASVDIKSDLPYKVLLIGCPGRYLLTANLISNADPACCID